MSSPTSNHILASPEQQKLTNGEIKHLAGTMKMESMMTIAFHKMGFTVAELQKYLVEGEKDAYNVNTIILKKWRAHHPGKATMKNFQDYTSETLPDFNLPPVQTSSPLLQKRISKSVSELPTKMTFSVFKAAESTGTLSMANGTGSSTPDVRIGQYGKLYSMDTEELKREVRNLIVKQETSDKEMQQMRRQTKETQDRIQQFEHTLYQQQAEIKYLRQLLTSGDTIQSTNRMVLDNLTMQSHKQVKTLGEVKLALNKITAMINDQKMTAKEAQASCNALINKYGRVTDDLSNLELAFNGLRNKQTNSHNSPKDQDELGRLQKNIQALHYDIKEVTNKLDEIRDKNYQRSPEEKPISAFHDVPESVRKPTEVRTLDRKFVAKPVRATEL